MSAPVVVELSLRRLVQLDESVDAAEGEGLKARWLFGQQLLTEPGPLQATVNEIAEERGKESTKALYNEFFRRRKFAERFDEEALHHAMMNGRSWYAIVNEDLASTAHLSAAKDDWATPQDLFDELDAEFHFTLDVCASQANAKCSRFFALTDDALNQRWAGVCWMNPPYSQVSEFMAKALESARAGATVVCLVPSRTDVGWFWDYARYGEVRLLKGRLYFVDDEGNTGPAPFPSVVVVFGREPGFVWYER